MLRYIGIFVLTVLSCLSPLSAQDTSAAGQVFGDLPASVTALPEAKAHLQNCARIHEAALKSVGKRAEALQEKAKKESYFILLDALNKETQAVIQELSDGNKNLSPNGYPVICSFMHGKNWKTPNSHYSPNIYFADEPQNKAAGKHPQDIQPGDLRSKLLKAYNAPRVLTLRANPKGFGLQGALPLKFVTSPSAGLGVNAAR